MNTTNISKVTPIEKYEMLLPKGYVIKNGSELYRQTGKEKNPFAFVCDYVPRIEVIYENERERQTLWTITWQEPNGIKRIEMIPKGKFSTATKITELYERGFPVTSDNASEMVKYLQRYETLFKDEIQKQLAYDQLGYIKGGFLLPDKFISSDKREDIVFQANAGNADYIEGFKESGSLQEWIANILEPIKTRKIPLAYILASIGSPLLNRFNVPTFIIEVANPTSQGKTIVMMCACSVWGSWDLHGTWYGTFAGIERRAVMLNHLPYFIDDTKNNMFRSDELSTLIYTLASGQEKTRSGLKENHISRKWNNIILSTGERKITEFSKAGGTSARVLAIYGKPIEHNPELVRNLEASTQAFYGTAGVSFLEWFVHQDVSKLDAFKSQLEAYERDYASKTDNPIIKRTSRYMAFIRLIADMVQEAFNVEIDATLLDELWLDIVQDAQEETADRPLQALKEAIELAERNKAKFYSKASDYEKVDAYGEWQYPYKVEGRLYNQDEGTIIYFYPEFLKAYLEKQGHDANTILKQWKERGYIKTSKNRNTYQKRSILEGKKKTLFIAIDLTHEHLQEEEAE